MASVINRKKLENFSNKSEHFFARKVYVLFLVKLAVESAAYGLVEVRAMTEVCWWLSA